MCLLYLGDEGRVSIEQLLESSGLMDALLPMESNEDPDSDEEESESSEESSESDSDEESDVITEQDVAGDDNDDDDDDIVVIGGTTPTPATVTATGAGLIQGPVTPLTVSCKARSICDSDGSPGFSS